MRIEQKKTSGLANQSTFFVSSGINKPRFWIREIVHLFGVYGEQQSTFFYWEKQSRFLCLWGITTHNHSWMDYSPWRRCYFEEKWVARTTKYAHQSPSPWTVISKRKMHYWRDYHFQLITKEDLSTSRTMKVYLPRIWACTQFHRVSPKTIFKFSIHHVQFVYLLQFWFICLMAFGLLYSCLRFINFSFFPLYLVCVSRILFDYFSC